MPTVLSTKKLSKPQKQLLLNSGIGLVEYNAISIQFSDFKIDPEPLENAIITSQNSAKAILAKKIRIKNCFCVGEKTASLLQNHQSKISEVAIYGKDLAKVITEKYADKNFTFFCGNKRREEIPSILKKKNVELKEIEVYKTEINQKQFYQEFDGILFFSPSGIQSFITKNEIKNSFAFCIGETTASEAKKHTENIIVATKPSIENVIVQVVKKFRQL